MSDLIASDDPNVVVAQSQVTLHFALRMPAGEVIDSNFDKAPAQFRLGDGNMPEGFETLLVGLRVGDERRFQVEPEVAFGLRQEGNIRRLDRSKFSDTEAGQPLEPGLMVSFAGPGGELPGVVIGVEERDVEVDFNHPLAGTVILFDVEILAVDNAKPV